MTFPISLQNLNQWVCSSKTNKLPMRAESNEVASVSKPESWSSFQVATQAVASGKYDYLGFVFTEADGLVGIDIDTGFEDGFPTDEALDIIKLCKSYTEISKSGRGFHILLKGTLPFKGKNNHTKGFEIYNTGRYFIMTGNTVIYEDIIENQEAIDYIVETYFKEELKERKSTHKNFIAYQVSYDKPSKVISLELNYPVIGEGGRNTCLTSLAGQLKTAGFSKDVIFTELLKANSKACKPMLTQGEIQSIVNSVCRYK